MFELMFGGIWTAFIALMTFGFYGGFGGGTITVNGEIVSQAEFNAMLWPKLFFAVFWIIGLAMLFKGFKKLFANVATSSIGRETVGYVLDVVDSHCYVNGNPVWDAKIIFLDSNNSVKTVSESVGLDYDKYPIGSFVMIKYHKDDVNIIGKASEYDAPMALKNLIADTIQNNEISGVDTAAEEIYIDGVRYVKENNTKAINQNNNHEKDREYYYQKAMEDNSNKFDV